MSVESDLLEKDPGLLAFFATLNAEPQSLMEICAHLIVKSRASEAERKAEREAAAEAYREAQARRRAPPPKRVVPPNRFAEEQLLALAKAIAKGVAPRFRALEQRLDALAPVPSCPDRLDERKPAAAVTPGLVTVDPIIANYVRSQVAPAEALARRVHALEQDAMQFRGVWDADLTYARGSVVTYAGGTWFALETNNTRPGTDGSWKLTVKAGQPPRSEKGTNR